VVFPSLRLNLNLGSFLASSGFCDMMLRIDTNTRGNRLLGSTTAKGGGGEW
jgi:hypothetical protein